MIAPNRQHLDTLERHQELDQVIEHLVDLEEFVDNARVEHDQASPGIDAFDGVRDRGQVVPDASEEDAKKEAR